MLDGIWGAVGECLAGIEAVRERMGGRNMLICDTAVFSGGVAG